MEILKLKYFAPIELAIERLRQFAPPEGYYGAFSGGKDSECIKKLAEEAGVKVDWHYRLTTVDPPELVYHIKNNYRDVIIDYPEKTMWQLIIENGIPPTRIQRYCCRILKESGGDYRFKITGVRQEESLNRKKKRREIEYCHEKGSRVLNPIIDWKESDVWRYLKSRQILSCVLYRRGFSRIGCIGCPLNNLRIEQFKIWPTYYRAYLRTFEIMLRERERKKLPTTWKTAQDVMNWWLYEMPKEDPNQMKMFEE